MSTSEATTVPALTGDSAYDRLPRRRRRFVDQYVMGGTATDAIRAIGCKSQHARSIAARWLREVDVQAAIEQRTTEVVAESGLRQERILREQFALATSDIRKLFRPDGSLKRPEELDDATAAAIAGIEVEEVSTGGREGTRFKYKMRDKDKPLDKLGQWLKLWDGSRPSINVDARSVTVNGESADAVRRIDRFVRDLAGAAGSPAASGANGPVLPAPVRDGASGHRASVDVCPDSGSSGEP